jgi:hypothetical protein
LTFVFCLYAENNVLTKKRLIEMMSEMYDIRHAFHKTDVGDGTENHAKRLIYKVVALKEEEYKVNGLLHLNEKYPMLLFRAFELQRHLRDKVCTRALWNRLTKARAELTSISGQDVDFAWDVQGILEGLGYRTSFSAMVRGPSMPDMHQAAKEEAKKHLVEEAAAAERSIHKATTATSGAAESKGEPVADGKKSKRKSDNGSHGHGHGHHGHGHGHGGGHGHHGSSKDSHHHHAHGGSGRDSPSPPHDDAHHEHAHGHHRPHGPHGGHVGPQKATTGLHNKMHAAASLNDELNARMVRFVVVARWGGVLFTGMVRAMYYNGQA